MKNLFTYVLILVFLTIRVSPAHGENLSLHHLKKKVVENPDSVLNVLFNLEKGENKTIPVYQIALLKSIAYNEKRMFPLVEKYAREALANDSINNNEAEKINALTLLATAQTFFGNYSQSISSLSEAMLSARASGNLAAELNILLTMAKTSFEMNQRQKGYDYIDQILSRGGASRDVRVLANVSSAYGVKVVELFTDDRFDDALKEGGKRLELINRIDQLGGAPDGYTDQQRAYTYARLASCAQNAGKKEEALNAYEAFNKTQFASTPFGRAYIIDYLIGAQKWDKVLAATSPLYPFLTNGDTINEDYRSLLRSDAVAMAGLGNYKEAYALSLRESAIRDSLYNRENTLRANEMASIFALNEMEMNLTNARNSLQKRKIFSGFALALAILAFIIIFLLFRAYRKSVREQKIAASRVDEMIELNSIKDNLKDSDRENMDMFAEMQTKILNSNIFKDPGFNRESIITCSGLPRTKVISLIEHYTGLSINDYINKLRVEHSVKLIQEHPDWTIDAIAEECGYVRRATYYSHFNKFFGITPAQYRKQKKDK